MVTVIRLFVDECTLVMGVTSLLLKLRNSTWNCILFMFQLLKIRLDVVGSGLLISNVVAGRDAFLKTVQLELTLIILVSVSVSPRLIEVQHHRSALVVVLVRIDAVFSVWKVFKAWAGVWVTFWTVVWGEVSLYGLTDEFDLFETLRVTLVIDMDRWAIMHQDLRLLNRDLVAWLVKCHRATSFGYACPMLAPHIAVLDHRGSCRCLKHLLSELFFNCWWSIETIDHYGFVVIFVRITTLNCRRSWPLNKSIESFVVGFSLNVGLEALFFLGDSWRDFLNFCDNCVWPWSVPKLVWNQRAVRRLMCEWVRVGDWRTVLRLMGEGIWVRNGST